jgi:hypothetical protein
MDISQRALAIAGMLAVCYLLSPSQLFAYLDPGTGSYLFQILIAGLVGGLFAVKIFWARIKEHFAKLRGKGGEEKKAEGEKTEEKKAED